MQPLNVLELCMVVYGGNWFRLPLLTTDHLPHVPQRIRYTPLAVDLPSTRIGQGTFSDDHLLEVLKTAQ